MEKIISVLTILATAAAATGVLHLIFGRSLVMRLWYRLFPGIVIACGAAWAGGTWSDVSILFNKVLIPFIALSAVVGSIILAGNSVIHPIKQAIEELNVLQIK